jgi:hypothetical protein
MSTPSVIRVGWTVYSAVLAGLVSLSGGDPLFFRHGLVPSRALTVIHLFHEVFRLQAACFCSPSMYVHHLWPAAILLPSTFVDGQGSSTSPLVVRFPQVQTVASPRRAFSRSVVHGAFRLPPRLHLSIRVNQREFSIADYAARHRIFSVIARAEQGQISLRNCSTLSIRRALRSGVQKL